MALWNPMLLARVSAGTSSTYTGTITVGAYITYYGYVQGFTGSLAWSPSEPVAMSYFIWSTDGSAVFISGNGPGIVTWNGQAYALTYNGTDAWEFSGPGTSGPYPTSGDTVFTFEP